MATKRKRIKTTFCSYVPGSCGKLEYSDLAVTSYLPTPETDDTKVNIGPPED